MREDHGRIESPKLIEASRVPECVHTVEDSAIRVGVGRLL